MKRLLSSSRFLVALGSVIAAVIVAFGGSEEHAGHVADTAVDLIKWFGTVWIGATTVEDAAMKLASKGKPVAGLGRDAMFGALLLMLVPSCSALTPGLDMRQGLETNQLTSYDKDSAFLSRESTTSSRRNVVAEGTGVKADFYPDGTPKTVDKATNLMTQASDPRDAATVLAHRDELNAQLALEGIRAARDFAALATAQRALAAPAITGTVELLNRLTPEERSEIIRRLVPASSPSPQ